MIHPTTKVCREVNSKLHARNMMIQLLALYTDLCATMHSVTDELAQRQTDGWTDGQITL